MKPQGIIFSPPMVVALMREIERPGTGKTMTRRLAWVEGKPKVMRGRPMTGFKRSSIWQRIKPGDLIWVRETHWRWGYWRKRGKKWKFHVKSYAPSFPGVNERTDLSKSTKPRTRLGWHKRPAIFLPKDCARITLVVEEVRIEQLKKISYRDTVAEGAPAVDTPGHPEPQSVPTGPGTYKSCRLWYRELWESLHGPESWTADPEVVVIRFKPNLCNIDKMPNRRAA